MATFTFEAVDGKGNKVKKEVDAEDRDDAMAKIKGMGLFPTKVKNPGRDSRCISKNRNASSGSPIQA